MVTVTTLTAIRESGLPEPLARRLVGLVLPSMCLQARLVEADSDLAIGASKAGGAPDLPWHVPWPVGEKRPLSFLCQIRLADFAAHASARAFPEEGWLSFFFDRTWPPFVCRQRGVPAWKVLHFRGDASELSRRATPSVLRRDPLWPCALGHTPGESLPYEQVPWFAILGLLGSGNLRERERLIACYQGLADRVHDLYAGAGVNHQLLGYADGLIGAVNAEDSMQVLCQRAYRPRVSALVDWRLLLQFDLYDAALGLEQDESLGRLFFWIRQQALETRSFDEVLLIKQRF